MLSSEYKLPEMVYLNYIYSGVLDISYDSFILLEPLDNSINTIVPVKQFARHFLEIHSGPASSCFTTRKERQTIFRLRYTSLGICHYQDCVRAPLSHIQAFYSPTSTEAQDGAASFQTVAANSGWKTRRQAQCCRSFPYPPERK